MCGSCGLHRVGQQGVGQIVLASPNLWAASGHSSQLAWSQELYGTADGYGLEGADLVPYVYSWVFSGSALMSGHRYCAAVALRCGVLPSAARMARGQQQHRRSYCEHCGPGQTEYLGHILQVCYQHKSDSTRSLHLLS